MGGGGVSAGDWNQIESVITDWNTAGIAQDQEESKVNLTFHLFELLYKLACWFLFMLFNFGFTVFWLHRSGIVNVAQLSRRWSDRLILTALKKTGNIPGQVLPQTRVMSPSLSWQQSTLSNKTDQGCCRREQPHQISVCWAGTAQLEVAPVVVVTLCWCVSHVCVGATVNPHHNLLLQQLRRSV